MIPLGVDLGTTFSVAGYVNPRGIPTLVPDHRDGETFRTPSVLHITEGGVLVGDAAERLLDDDPAAELLRFMKMDMGSGEGHVDRFGRTWTPEQLSALVVRKLVRDAESHTNEDVGNLVIAVPAQFGDRERRATKLAARLAGLPEPALVEEPVAAANYYGLAEARGDQTLFVYDLGGGTFDATILQASPDGLYVLATEGTNTIGGRNMDEAVMELVADAFRREHGVEPLDDPPSEARLRRFAVDAKLKLSQPGEGRIRRSLLLAGRTHDVLLTRRHFDRTIKPLLEGTLDVCRRCLSSAGLDWSLIDKVLLTGGSSLVPAVEQMMRTETRARPDDLILQNPHHAVGFGAAVVAAVESGREGLGAPLVQQIASFDLGMRVFDPRLGRPAVKTLIARNSPLPARHTSTFYTTRADQRRMAFEFVQTREGSETSLGHFLFEPLPTRGKNHPVEVTVMYDPEGIVRVTARDPRSGQQIQRAFADESEGIGPVLAAQKPQVDGMTLLD